MIAALQKQKEEAQISQKKSLPKLTIQDVLVNRRAELNLTLATIAEYMGIRSPEFIGMVEKGKRGFDLNKIPLLADILKFKRDDLVKIYLADEFPLAYDALFVEHPGRPQTNYSVRAEAQELVDLYQSLTKERREEIMTQLRRLHDIKVTR